MPQLSELGYDESKHNFMVENVRAQMIAGDISSTVARLAAGYVEIYDLLDASVINQGLCLDFANDLKSLYPQARLEWLDDLSTRFKSIAHSVSIINGRYYDAVDTEGVDTPAKLALVVFEESYAFPS